MNILKKTKDLNAKVKNLKQLIQKENKAETFENFLNKLEPTEEKLTSFEGTLDFLIRHQIPVEMDLSLIYSLAQRINDLKERYKDDHDVITDPFPGEDSRHILFQPLNQIPENVSKTLEESWKNWASKQLPNINKNFLNILAGITTLRQPVTTLQDFQDQVEVLCNSLPTSDQDLERLKELGKSIEGIWVELKGIPGDVISFLRNASDPLGADLEMLTPEVKTWLKDHQLLQNLKIRIT